MQDRKRRLPEFDYGTPGAYFVTICANERQMLFEDPEIQDVIVRCWAAIPEHISNVTVDSFVVMPNHVHGIVMIEELRAVGALHAKPLRLEAPRRAQARSLSAIIRSFKSAVTRELHVSGCLPTEGKIWQYSFYDRVIRNAMMMN